ncbi:hypothetical protein H6F74_27795 [Trichocoleus sp. FACHB-90]|uniref:hypothetical protein n=1 Tax=Cyanophyceae TaxID=3028117 RepID=UPI0016838F47|nr:hypothetical protein [Trichocoleus sp. FACHB-90]MBD1930001.1 hypothetical protein [Trichocoleus sp. FACHB-90]
MSPSEVPSGENRSDHEQVQQSIFENVQVGGNLTTGDNIQNISIYQPEPPKPVGILQNIPYTGATFDFPNLSPIGNSINSVVAAPKIYSSLAFR